MLIDTNEEWLTTEKYLSMDLGCGIYRNFGTAIADIHNYKSF